mmetsp:Transcript_53001/g.141677  ORF Transcript_53001/g.141677 Transcript_53001/m.141677 type:complete len:90 (+) Transcript_53001:643-912(+)
MTLSPPIPLHPRVAVESDRREKELGVLFVPLMPGHLEAHAVHFAVVNSAVGWATLGGRRQSMLLDDLEWPVILRLPRSEPAVRPLPQPM